MLSFDCPLTLSGLIRKLGKFNKHFGGAALKLCHEASYVGFSLQRDLAKKGYDSVVVAPSNIPRRPGKSVKPDRIDARDSSEFYANGLLTVVILPDAEVEQDRDLLRARRQLVQQPTCSRGACCANKSNGCSDVTASITRPRASERGTGHDTEAPGARQRTALTALTSTRT